MLTTRTGSRAAMLGAATLALLAGGALLSSLPAAAETPEQFFAGKTIRIVVGAGAGGGYDLYGRVLAQFYGRHIPGKPAVIVENMPGGSGNASTNYVYEVAPKNGLALNMPFYDQPIRQLARPQGIRYDLRKVAWIGNMAELTTVLAVSSSAPATTLDQAKTTEVIMGATGVGGDTYVVPTLANTLIGTKFRIVSGYTSTTAVTQAMEKGEVHGRGGSWLSWKTLNAHLVRDGKVRVLAQIGMRPDPDLPQVPMMEQFARGPEDIATIRFMLALPIGMSRAVLAPPGVPADRIQALRRAFDATMTDREFLAAAAKRGAPVRASTGEEVEKMVAEIMSATPERIARAKEIAGYK